MWKKQKACLSNITEQAKELLLKVSDTPHHNDVIICQSCVISKMKTVWEVLPCFTNDYFLLSTQFCMLSFSSDPAGAFWGFYSDCPWSWGRAAPKGRWKEGLETSLLCAQGLGHLLCTQRKIKGMTNQTMRTFYILFHLKCKQILNLVPNVETRNIVNNALFTPVYLFL